MNPETLRSKLETHGELMVNVAEIDQPLELHLHDAEIGDETITLELTDGELEVDLDEVVASWSHTHSLADYGLE